MADRADGRSVCRVPRHALHDVVLTLQSAAVGHHVTRDGHGDRHRVWSVMMWSLMMATVIVCGL